MAKALRTESSLAATLAVALSGYALPEGLERAREAGFDRHLAKPAGPEQLAELLASVKAAG